MNVVYKITGREILDILQKALREEVKAMTINGASFSSGVGGGTDVDISDIANYFDDEKEYEIGVK